MIVPAADAEMTNGSRYVGEPARAGTVVAAIREPPSAAFEWASKWGAALSETCAARISAARAPRGPGVASVSQGRHTSGRPFPAARALLAALAVSPRAFGHGLVQRWEAARLAREHHALRPRDL